MYFHSMRSLVALFFLLLNFPAFSQFITLHRDILLCPGEVLNLNGINYSSSDTTNVYLNGVPPAPDTLIFYRIRVLDNVANTTVCNCHPASFFKTFGRDNQPEAGAALVRSSDNNLYLAGLKNGKTFIQKLNRFGEQIWIREFSISTFEAVTPTEIIEDSEGMIVGCGTQGQAAGLRKGFVFRYDPETNTFLWARTIAGADAIAGGILEQGPGGDFLYYQNPMFSGGDTDAEIMKIDRVTGNIMPGFAQRYEHAGSDVLRKLLLVDNVLYGTGSSNSSGVSRRQLLARFDETNGAPVWSRLSHLDTAATGNLFGRDLVLDNNTLVAAYDGDESSSQLAGTAAVFLQKTELDGQIIWLKRYDLQGRVLKLLSVPDGYVLYGQNSANDHYVLKTDKNGTPVWGKQLIFGPVGAPLANASGPAQALEIDGSLFFTGTATTGNNDVFLLAMNADGSVSDSCNFLQTLNVPFEDVMAPVQTLINLTEKPSVAAGQTVNVPWQITSMFETLLCPDCIEPDPCPARNDFVIDMNASPCSDGEVNLQINICDLDGGALPSVIEVTFYTANPLTGAAQDLGNYQFSTGAADSCFTATLHDLASEFGPAAAQNGFQIFAVVNFDGLLSTPFTFNDFPVTDLEECNYENNLDSFTVQHPDAPILDLGPDKSICAGETAILTSGPIFFKYQWSNGFANDTIVVSQNGQFRLTVTDVCGLRQSDTIAVAVKQLPTLVVSGSVCPGHPTMVYGQVFTQGGIFVDTIPSITGASCDTIVTFFITQMPYLTRDVQVPFCNTVTINGITYDESGLARDTVPAVTGCDTIVFYFLNQLPKHLRFDTIKICPGGSVTINGHVYTQPGLIIDTIPSIDGISCDTLIRQPLVFLPQVVLNQTIEFCPGDTVTIGGQSYTQPGFVTGSLPGFGADCDTVVNYTLQYAPVPASNLSMACPPDVDVVVPGGSAAAVVHYAAPTAISDCTCPGVDLQLSSGPASGAAFPPGVTQVCYSASDHCNVPVSCCFEVRVTEEDDPCDTKTTACIKYDLMRITSDPAGQYTYRVRVTNNCANKLIYTAIQLPNGLTAVSPGNGVYTSPEGHEFAVRNPNFSPVYSIRFKSTGDSIAGGQSATFEYTLPEQTHPTFIHLVSRLAPQVFYEAHLNTFDCPVGVTLAQDRSDEGLESQMALKSENGLFLYPNPSGGELFADVSRWEDQVLSVRVLDGLGQVVLVSTALSAQGMMAIRMPEGVASGIYFVEVWSGDGEREVGRFVFRQGN